jgi:hypothetical protein
MASLTYVRCIYKNRLDEFPRKRLKHLKHPVKDAAVDHSESLCGSVHAAVMLLNAAAVMRIS